MKGLEVSWGREVEGSLRSLRGCAGTTCVKMAQYPQSPLLWGFRLACLFAILSLIHYSSSLYQFLRLYFCFCFVNGFCRMAMVSYLLSFLAAPIGHSKKVIGLVRASQVGGLAPNRAMGACSSLQRKCNDLGL